MSKLFVYGTLKQGYWNHNRLKKAIFLGPAITKAEFTLASMGSFPAMIKGNKKVMGELYEITPEIKDSCDSLEGHPTFYRRTEIELEDGEKVETYIYQNTYPCRSREDIYERDDLQEWRMER